MSPKQRVPIATLLLIAANIGAAFALVWQPDLLGDFGFSIDRPSVFAAVTCLFLHVNLFHLLGNMLFLAAVGPAVEFAAKTWRFLFIYLTGGLAGVGLHWLLAAKAVGEPPLIGASGAISACAAFFTIRFFRVRVPIAPKIAVPVPAITGIWVFLQVLGAVIKLGGEFEGGIAWWAHIGGFAAGLVWAGLFRAGKEANMQFGHQVLDQMNERGPAAALAAAESHLREHPEDTVALEKVIEAARDLSDHAKEAEGLWKLLERTPESEQAPLLNRLTELDEMKNVPSLRRTLLADRLKNSHPETAELILSTVLEGDPQDPQRPEALLALAEIRRTREEPFESLIKELTERFELHPATELAKARGLLP
ncbi:MAG: rhomboid family intramembrane serine protease [Fimbriimonadaceae bacterium]|nr:rhomboid family intramembrane serine protease [Fimbriimonadaceae bacterium]